MVAVQRMNTSRANWITGLAHRPLDRRYSALWPELAADIG
jgi:hypothetical protein